MVRTSGIIRVRMMGEETVTNDEQARATISEQARVTVVIPTYNRARFITRGIRSVLRQTISNWKLLIVDDGSSDHTYRVVKPYLKDPRIRYIRRRKNKGVCYTLNEALKHVDTEFFSQLDADDWYTPNTLEVCLKRADQGGKRVAVVYGHEKIWKLGRDGKIRLTEKRKKRQIKGKYDFITFHKMIYPRFYRTEALRAVHGWSNKVPQGGRFAEDRQILLKLAGAYKFKAAGKVLYNRLVHHSNNSRRKNRKKYAQVTRYLYKSALKRWGNKFKPKFIWVSGRLKVGKLIRK